MRSIELDAANWESVLEFYDALLAALGAPHWHGRSIDALADTMIWSDETNAVKPPYVVKIVNSAMASSEVRDELYVVRDWLTKSRREFQARNGHDVEVSFEIL